MELQCKHNISVRKVPEVIKLILNKLADISVLRLQSPATLSRLFMRANIVAKQHCSQLLLEHADKTRLTGSTLHQDATTKPHPRPRNSENTPNRPAANPLFE